MYDFFNSGVESDDECFISGEEKMNEFFNVCDNDKTGEAKPSINISERRCKLKANEPVSERSERASEGIVGFATGLSASEG